MADGFTGKNFAGGQIDFAAKEINGKQVPAQFIADPSTGAPQDIGTLLQEIAYRLSDIADSVGNMMPDTAGRIRVAAETLGTLSTITTVTTVTTLTTMTNQAQMGGMALNAYIPHITQMSEGDLRRNVVIS